MNLLLITLSTLCLAVAGKYAFGQWFNHLSLYSAIWGIALFLFELRLIDYYPLEHETWAILFVGSLSFVIGALTVWAYKKAVPGQSRASREISDPIHLDDKNLQRSLTRVLWILNVITFAAVLQHWYVTVKLVGGIPQVLVLGNLLYSYRIEHGMPGGVPYLKSLTLLSSMLGGVLTAMTGRLKFAALVPLVTVFLGELVAQGRSLLIQSGIFFMAGYLLTRPHIIQRSRVQTVGVRIRRFAVLALVVAVMVMATELIRSNRGGMVSNFSGTTSALKKYNRDWVFSPSLYLYLTANYGVLNQYLKHNHGDAPWGGNSWGPVYHILEKLGSTTRLQSYGTFYPTPAVANTGTYLLDLYEDYGLGGIVVYPYLLALLTSIVWFRLRENFRFSTLVILSSLLAIVVMSLFMIILRGGDLYMVAGVGIVLGRYLDRHLAAHTARTARIPGKMLEVGTAGSAAD